MQKVSLVMTCPFCETEHEVVVYEEQLAEYWGGELAQNALPQLTPTEREQIISHLCPQCQSKIFG